MTRTELASELGKLGKGVKKTMSKAAVEQRKNAGKLRWKNHVPANKSSLVSP